MPYQPINQHLYNHIMNTYKIKFNGRRIGNKGKLHNITTEVKAEHFDKARSKLYDSFEHIRVLTMFENNKQLPVKLLY